jgi:hypothetical protein
MIVPIKIQCGCGQRYAFDIEATGDLMPNTVACPVCGTDGTAAANVAIAHSLSAQSAVAVTPAGGPRIRIATPPPSTQPDTPAAPAPAAAPRRPALLPGQIDHNQAKHEAKAKIFWGDPPEKVVAFLRIQGFSREEASDLVRELYQERAATVRANGIKKIFTGIGLIAVPIVSLIVFIMIGVIPMKIFGLTLAVGCWGVWKLINGIIMVLAPKTEHGDLADQ